MFSVADYELTLAECNIPLDTLLISDSETVFPNSLLTGAQDPAFSAKLNITTSKMKFFKKTIFY